MVEQNQRLHAIIHGRVQGVFFRETTLGSARRLGLVGWVCNRPDGTVELVAEGPVKRLSELERFLHHGPPSAIVERVEVSYEAPSDELHSFEIRY
jgi:acylphosphatase